MSETTELNDGTREFNAMQRVKRRFFAMRNGDLAQQMADLSGRRYRINFGLNLPQITEIARDFLPGGSEVVDLEAGGDFDRADFARRLRDNTSTRESMLIAPILFPVDQLSVNEAISWVAESPTPEVVDILCMKMLRNHPAAVEIAKRLLEDGTANLAIYAAIRLVLNLLQTGKLLPEEARSIIDSWEKDADVDLPPLLVSILRQYRNEMAFLTDLD